LHELAVPGDKKLDVSAALLLAAPSACGDKGAEEEAVSDDPNTQV